MNIPSCSDSFKKRFKRKKNDVLIVPYYSQISLHARTPIINHFLKVPPSEKNWQKGCYIYFHFKRSISKVALIFEKSPFGSKASAVILVKPPFIRLINKLPVNSVLERGGSDKWLTF